MLKLESSQSIKLWLVMATTPLLLTKTNTSLGLDTKLISSGFKVKLDLVN